MMSKNRTALRSLSDFYKIRTKINTLTNAVASEDSSAVSALSTSSIISPSTKINQKGHQQR